MFPTIVLIELVCYLASLFYLRKNKAGWWYYFTWFMLFTTLFDGTGWLLAVVFHQRNHWLYNIVLIYFMFFMAWVFDRVYSSFFNARKWIITSLGIFLLFFTYETFTHTFTLYNYRSSTLASVLIVIAGGCYYYLLLKNDEYIDLLRHPPFWLVTGAFFFHFASTAINLFFPELMKINILEGIPLRFFISSALNVILYGCWTYAFRCRYLQTI